MNKEKRNLVINVFGIAVGLGIIGTAAVYSKGTGGTDGNTSQQEKTRYAQIEFRGKYPASDMSPYDQGYIGHVHYTLAARLPSCQAEFDDTTAGIASLVFPASCPENVPLEGMVSAHQDKCGPLIYTPTSGKHDFMQQDRLMVKTSTVRDAPPVTMAIISCR